MMKYLSLGIEVMTFGSFIWSALFYFGKNKAPSKKIQFIKYGGSFFILLHLFILGFKAELNLPSFCIGISIFLLSLFLFWWSLALNWRDNLHFAFVESDKDRLVTKGAYRYIRHPIYTAYLLAWLGGSIICGQPLLMITFFAMGYIYLSAAKFEEEEFLKSQMKVEYAAYIKRSGQFIPKLF